MHDCFLIRSLADIEEIERTPWEERLNVRNTYDMLRQGAAINPDHPAIYFFAQGKAYEDAEVMSYAALLGSIHQTANLFYDLGIQRDDVIAFILPNFPETHSVIWGGEAAGIIHPINPLLEARQMVELLKASRAKLVVASGFSPELNIWEKVIQIRQELPHLLIVQLHGAGNEAEGIYSYDALLPKYPDDHLMSRREIAPDDICAYFATGGTTGAPKFAQHTHLNETFEAWVIASVAQRTREDTLLSGLPLFHVNAVHITGLAPFSVGASVVLAGTQGYRDRSVIENLWKIVERYRVTSFSGVPTLYASLLQVPVNGQDIRSVKHVRCGAAPMSVEVFRAFQEHTGITIVEGYGLTEGTCSSTGNPISGEKRIGSVGLRYPYQEVRVVHLDDEGRVQECAPNEIGQVVMRGPHVIPGYLNPEHDAGLWTADGWLKTGDLGRLDDDGYLWLTGRAKDLIIRGGHNIDPAVIEEALYTHPAVALAAAVGKPDVYAGELPVAYVQLKTGMSLSESELFDHVRERISERAAIPKAITVIETMPVTPVGKIFKPALRHDAIRRAYQEALAPLEGSGRRVEVVVSSDQQRGTLAMISFKGKLRDEREALEVEVGERLAGYTTAHQVVWNEDQ